MYLICLHNKLTKQIESIIEVLRNIAFRLISTMKFHTTGKEVIKKTCLKLILKDYVFLNKKEKYRFPVTSFFEVYQK